MAEAYAMTADPRLAEPVRRATAFIESARNDDEGGWRYEPGQAGDSSVLGWQVMAIVSARRAGIDVSDESFEAARHWLDLASTPGAPGLYAYQPGMEPTMAMTAESMFVQRLLGTPRHARRMRQSADFIIEQLPDWDEDANTYAWYYATLALYQHGGNHWEIWNEALMPELIGNQRTDGRAGGSWDPADKWSRIGGRVYQTAICALTLEVYYRYLPSFVGDADEASGLITGVVLDDESGLPIPLASVRLDLPDAEPLVQRALVIFRKALGPEHPNVAMSLNTLAMLYQVQGRYDEAEPRFRQALEIRERTLGPDHSLVALSLRNLARLYAAQNRYAEAEPPFKRVLLIMEK
ncbi:MAG: tetratricopeptide repeat protein, partial [Chloroflexi bacterium]|nr:tetratricopeptide repeat protein [Chloroflexota bacterium]